MIKLLVISILIILFSLLVLFVPNYVVEYVNSDNLYFNLSKILIDYPHFKYILGFAFLVTGLVILAYVIMHYARAKTAFVIQQSGDGDYGNPSLSFPKIAISNRDPLYYENIASIDRCTKAVLDLDKNRIERFYSSLSSKKRISFLGVALFPFLVYSGFVVGSSGQKISYYHYNRQKEKAVWLYPGIKEKNKLKIPDVDKNSSDQLTVAVSVSYLIDKELVKSQFGDTCIAFIEAESIGTETIKNRKTLDAIANAVREYISKNANKDINVVNLLLSCPAELCFAIGTKLSSPGLPEIRVFNYNRKTKGKKWDWYIVLDKNN